MDGVGIKNSETVNEVGAFVRFSWLVRARALGSFAHCAGFCALSAGGLTSAFWPVENDAQRSKGKHGAKYSSWQFFKFSKMQVSALFKVLELMQALLGC